MLFRLVVVCHAQKSSAWFELDIVGRREAPVRSNSAVRLGSSCSCLGPGRRSVLGHMMGPVWPGPAGRGGGQVGLSDAGELVPQAGRQDALHLLHDEVERSKQRAEKLRTHTHTNQLGL